MLPTTMEYTISEKQSVLTVRVEKLLGKHDKVLQALEECAAGRCTYSTNQYVKLESFEIVSGKDSVDITLKPKSGERLDRSELDNCMQYILKTLSRE